MIMTGTGQTTVVVKHAGRPGVVAGLLGCVFGVLGIFTLGLIFVPLAAICSVVGLLRGLTGVSLSGIGCSLLAGALTFWGFVVSPSLWLLVGAGILAQHLPASRSSAAPTAAIPRPWNSGPSPSSATPEKQLALPAPLEGEIVEDGHLCDTSALAQAIARKYPGIAPASSKQEIDHLLYVFGCGVPPAAAQDAEVTCSWAGGRQACHTLNGWEEMARLWCDRYQAAKARREQEQALGWGTNAMYGSSSEAEFTRDQQIEVDTLSICTGEQYGLAAAQRQASTRMPQ
jgi:hypothetical protein